FGTVMHVAVSGQLVLRDERVGAFAAHFGAGRDVMHFDALPVYAEQHVERGAQRAREPGANGVIEIDDQRQPLRGHVVAEELSGEIGHKFRKLTTETQRHRDTEKTREIQFLKTLSLFLVFSVSVSLWLAPLLFTQRGSTPSRRFRRRRRSSPSRLSR